MAVKRNRLAELLNDALQDSYLFSPQNCHKIKEIFNECLKLFERDNTSLSLSNENGILCGTYPSKIIIPTKQVTSRDNACRANDISKFIELVPRGRLARTRGRFPVPSVLVGNKFICRSSTLSSSMEIYAQQGLHDYWPRKEPAQSCNSHTHSNDPTVPDNSSHSFSKDISVRYSGSGPCESDLSFSSTSNPAKLANNLTGPLDDEDQNEWLLEKVRKTDIDILRRLKVNVICDLMVENKKAKYGLSVTSSEKIDRHGRYRSFDVISIPYPGCEFFTDYSHNNYDCKGLQFNWNQSFIDAELHVPSGKKENSAGVKWKDYKEWDLLNLTQNYLKLMLKCLVSTEVSGILVHCISGWDRTPLYVSLLRLSLWADGLIHQSLNVEEIVYLTLAYDWLMFGHQFCDRIKKSEEIMHFCFEFLKFMVAEEFSLLPVKSLDELIFYCADQDKTFATDSSMNLDEISFLTESSENQSHNKSCLNSVEPAYEVGAQVDFNISDKIKNVQLNSSANFSDGGAKISRLSTQSNEDNKIKSENDSNKNESQKPTDSNAAGNNSKENANPCAAFEDALPSSDPPTIKDSSSFASSISSSNGFSVSDAVKEENDNANLRLKLDKRREKLLAARNTFFSAYNSVVPSHMESMQRKGVIGSLVQSLGSSLAKWL